MLTARAHPIGIRLLAVLAGLVCLLALVPATAAAADRAFSSRWETHTRGNITTAANTLMSCSGSGTTCVDARNGIGSLTALTNGGTMAYVNADSDGSTFNSSAATLTIPAGATVAWAGLYWGGDPTAGTGGAAAPSPALTNTVRLDTPAAGGYSTITASVLDTASAPHANRFQAFADVTSQVQAAGSGTYWAANVQAGSGADRYAGWTLVVAYRRASEPVRHLSVFDGMVSVLSGTNPTIALSGFQVPASGPVNVSLGFTAWEGELGWTGDPVTLNGTTISDPANPANNFFNASIATGGSHVTTKTPNYVNQFGFDSDVFTGTGLLANGATSATIGMSSAIDVYHAGVATFAVDQIPEVPTNTSAPGVTGTATDGQTLTATPGSWGGTTLINYAYQWQRCDGAGANCSNIAGATGSTYTLTASDVGATVRAVVTATNTEGTGTAASPVSAAVQAIPPANTALPAISGTARDGSTLTASTGTFSGSSPFVYGYQWRRCDSAGLTCTNIAGASGSTYTQTSADVGSTIRVAVTATNGGGSATATSGQTGVVAALAPANTAAPALSGTERDGATLTASAGTWTGTTPMSFAYQWRRCDSAGASCVDIAGATGSAYTLTPADVGATVRATVTATNAGGAASAGSAASGVIAAQAPVNTAVPSFAGTARDGSTLTGANGSWTGTPAISYAHQWQRCDSAGANCADIASATGASYALTAADVGSTVRLRVTASNAAGSAAASSAASGVIAALAPSGGTPPAISGTPRDGETLAASTGTWSGTAPLAFSYQWRRCDSAGLSCTDVAGATGSTYTLGAGDVGGTMRVVVTATNGGGSASAASAQTAPVAAAPPVNTTVPAVFGTERDGSTLTAGDGTWTGTPVISFSRQWQRCDSSGASCADITGATGTSYALTAADVGSTVRLQVTATNAAGSASAASAASGVVAAQAPVNTIAPAVSGTERDGSTLTAGDGTWTGTPVISFSHQWQRCDSSGASCADIAGATGATYALASADVGNTVRVTVTATNAAGSAVASSAPSAPVAPQSPASSAAPSISGIERDGSTLTAAAGTWTGTAPIGFTYQWRRCDSAGLTCSDISGATGATYDLAPADVDATLRVVVTATNGGGSAAATSAQTGVIGALAPVNTALPTVSGTERDGATLTAADGSWTGTPAISFSHQWRRCDASGANCADIAGATGATYALTAADVGHAIRVMVTATNAAGSAAAASAPSGAIAADGPASVAPPTIAGTPRDGEAMTATDGSWAGTGPFSYAYQWQRCDSVGAMCVNIPGATASSLALAPADVGTTVRVRVTATNAAGSATASSAASPVIQAIPPANVTPPAVSGTERDGQTLSAGPGTWTGTPALAMTYQWQRCDAAGASCADVAGATSAGYPLGAADVGHTLRVRVTATNAGGSAVAGSAPTAVVAAQAPASDGPPTISGTARDGQTLSAAPGTWTGTGPFSFSYRWQRCDASGANCADIAGAADPDYELVPADIGSRVRAVVTATNAAGSASAPSQPSAVVAAIPPANATPPGVSGTLRDGSTLTADRGTWTGSPTISYGYRWQRCDGGGANCADIAGATGSTYELREADVDSTVRVVVTATNDGGSATATAPATAAIAALAPASTGVPSVSGPARDGETLTASNGNWTGTGPIGFTYQWQRCDSGGANCVDIGGATDPTYLLTDADVGRTVRVRVTGTSGSGSDTGVSAVTAVVGAAAAPPAPPAQQPEPDPEPQAPSPDPAPQPQPDLGSLPGSMLSATACQQAGGGRQLPFYVPGAGQLRIRIAPNGVVTKGAPMIAAAVKPKRRVTKAIRAVTYTLNGRKLRSQRKAPYALTINPALLGAAPRQTLVVSVTPKKGKSARPAVVSLSSEPCPDLLSVLHRPNKRASMLGLRVDTRKGVRSVTFKAPAKLLAKPGTKGSAGTMRLGVAGQPARSLKLAFPKKKSKVATLIAPAGGPQVTVKGGTVTVTGLPAGTGIVELKLKGRGMRKTPRATLRASIQTDAGARSLSQKLGLKR